MRKATPASERVESILVWLRRYAQQRMDVHEMHARTRVPPSLVLDFAEQGLFGLNLPRLYGGLELSATDTMRVLEQLAAIDLTLAEFVVGHHTSTIPIVKYGAPDFRDIVLPSLAQGRKIGAFALTEEMAGSNPRALTSE